MFSAFTAISLAEERLRERADEILMRVTQEREVSEENARKYAARLADGGDPIDHPEIERASRYGGPLVSDRLGMQIVYNAWNEARGGSLNPHSPLGDSRAHGRWRVGEYVAERIGEPILYSKLTEVMSSMAFRPSSTDVIEALIPLQGETHMLVKGKIGGRTAYMLRERVGDETLSTNWGVVEEKLPATVAA
jgi:hypothetical protein